ncbi:hypothetical protein D3C79_688760 [compost metagenome]
MGGHGTATEALVLAEGDALEALDQANAQAVDDVLGQARKQLGLHHIEGQGGATQGQGEQQHQADVAGGNLPVAGEELVHPLQRGIAMPQQHFIDQQRQQQGDRHTAQRCQHGHAIGDPQGFFMPQGQAADFCPAQAISMHRAWPWYRVG